MTDKEIIAKGFKPWPSGNRSCTGPEDYDGGNVLLRNGSVVDKGYILHYEDGSPYWCDEDMNNDIIGYHPKQPAKPHKIAIPDGPAPEWAVKRWHELWESAGKPPHWEVGGHLIAMLEEPPAEDPLRECLIEAFGAAAPEFVSAFRDALDKRGLTVAAK